MGGGFQDHLGGHMPQQNFKLGCCPCEHCEEKMQGFHTEPVPEGNLGKEDPGPGWIPIE